jgi:multiple sugar transport system ATP-binding protein
VATVAFRDVTKVFPDGTVAVDNLSLDIGEGEFMVLLGPSGCGKSTVLRMVAGLEKVSSGTILLDGVVANDLPPRDRRVAMVFQDFALFPHITVGENIGFPLRLSKVDPAERAERVANVAAALGIADLLGRRPGQLSGGQRQRVAIGRAVLRRPVLFLMDEPLSNLDTGLRAELRAEITELTRRLGVTTLYVTHDQAEALTMADRVAILRRGVLQDVGTPTQVYHHPANLYVAAFLGAPRMTLLEAQVYVHLDEYIELRLGGQALRLAWTDPRAAAVARYHGERVALGIRAEAVTPVATDTPGDVLRGRIRYLEYHGHESLAFLDVGGYALAVDDLGVGAPDPFPAPDGRWLGSRIRRGFARSNGRPTPVEAQARPAGANSGSAHANGRYVGGVSLATGRHHRRPAELVLRLAPYPAVGPGQLVAVRVDMGSVHVFDERGKRVDVRWDRTR